MDGKSQQWRTGADKLLLAIAKDNRYIVSDILIVFLESAGYGLADYSPIGGVFKRAAKLSVITKIKQPKKSKQSLWSSNVYRIASEGLKYAAHSSDPVTYSLADGSKLFNQAYVDKNGV